MCYSSKPVDKLKNNDHLINRLESDFLDQYSVEGEIGEGGMATVLLCKQKNLNRSVAVKFLTSQFDSSSRSRFMREARTHGALKHPNIVEVYEFGVSADTPYLVLEHLHGLTLTDYLEEKGPLSLKETIAIALDICSALDHAHSKNILHRDLKSSNVFITSEGTTKVLDFGLAITLDDRTRLTQTGYALGTPVYMAPEQRDGQDAVTQSDLFTIGLLICEMLVKRDTWTASALGVSVWDYEERIQTCFSEIKDKLPIKMIELLEELLDKEPEQRPDSAKNVANRLQKIKTSLAKTVQGKTVQGKKQKSKRPIVVQLFFLSLFLLLMVLFMMKPYFASKPAEVTPPKYSTSSSSLSVSLKALSASRGDFQCKLYSVETGKFIENHRATNCSSFTYTAAPLSPDKRYRLIVNFFSDTRDNKKTELHIKTKPWVVETVVKNHPLLGPPAIRGDNLYFLTRKKQLHCYSISKTSPIWMNDDDLDFGHIAIDQNNIYIAETERSFVQCRELANGKLRWKTKLPNKCRRKIAMTNGRLLIHSHYAPIFCLNKSDGEIKWKGKHSIIQKWFVLGEHLVYSSLKNLVPFKEIIKISSGDTVSSLPCPSELQTSAVALSKNKYYHQNTDNSIEEVIPLRGKREVFKATSFAEDMILVDEVIYLLHKELLVAHKVSSGALLWSTPLRAKNEARRSLFHDRGLLFLLEEKKSLRVYSAQRGEKISHFQIPTVFSFGLTPVKDGIIFSTSPTTIGHLPYN